VFGKIWPWIVRSDFAPQLEAAWKIPHRYEDRTPFWSHTLDWLGPGPVLFLEFGVYRGESLKWFAEHLTHPDSRLIGFDTFTGLPEEWAGNAAKGHFDMEGNVPKIDDKRVAFKKGLFSDTLPNAMEEVIQLAQGRTMFVHIDADLFSSTLFVLSTLWPHVKSYYVLFDEFFGEESLALTAFLKAYPCRFKMLSADEAMKPYRVFGTMQQ
jgi:hypothetical protein